MMTGEYGFTLFGDAKHIKKRFKGLYYLFYILVVFRGISKIKFSGNINYFKSKMIRSPKYLDSGIHINKKTEEKYVQIS